jgi:hypothetical protein
LEKIKNAGLPLIPAFKTQTMKTKTKPSFRDKVMSYFGVTKIILLIVYTSILQKKMEKNCILVTELMSMMRFWAIFSRSSSGK